MRIRTGVYWSAGARRDANQDSLSLQHVAAGRGECLFAAVCDGIGSLAVSEEASGYAVRHMTDWFYQEGKELIYQNSPKELILLALQQQIGQIQEKQKKFQQNRNLQTGTTFSSILLIKNRYYLVHIGDSRIYQIRVKSIPIVKPKYNIVCLTRDDRNDKGFLLKCLGVSGRDRACFETGTVRKGTVFLLCTDGFFHGGGTERCRDVLGPVLNRKRQRAEKRAGSEEILERKLEMLGEHAIRSGSMDNMAAIAVVVR